MESSSNPTTTKYQQVTVEVPEDRLAEFHAFFGRFLAVSGRRGRRGRPGRHHRGGHGHGCGHRQPGDGGESAGSSAETTEV